MPPVDLQALAFREITLTGARVYTREDFAEAVRMLEPMAEELGWLAGETYLPEVAPRLFEQLVGGTGPLKAILRLSAFKEEIENRMEL